MEDGTLMIITVDLIPDNEWAPAWGRRYMMIIGWAPLSPYALFSINIKYTYDYYVPYNHWNYVQYDHFVIIMFALITLHLSINTEFIKN
jgi:hypothetical protein